MPKHSAKLIVAAHSENSKSVWQEIDYILKDKNILIYSVLAIGLFAQVAAICIAASNASRL